MGAKGQPPPPATRLAQLAASQHGVASRAQLGALGLSASTIESAIRQGRLHRVHRSVYAVGHPRLSHRGRWMAATLTCRGRPALSHGSAAALWQLGAETDGTVHVTVASHARRLPGGITVHTSRDLPPNETTRRDGIPVTTPARTLMDLATQSARRPLERALDAGARLRLLGRRELEAIVAAHCGHHGAARLATVLADHEPGSTFTRSELEERFLAICRRHRLPQPQMNVRLEGYEVDFLWPTERLIVEADGFASHGTREAFERDRDRDARLALAGYLVLRVSYRRIASEPKVVASLVRSALRR